MNFRKLTKRVSMTVAIMIGLSAGFADASAAQDEPPGKDRACVLDCRHVYTQCSHAAYSEGRMCVQECGDLIATAREICAVEPESEECDSARSRAAACVRACREATTAALRVCRADAKECVALCPDAEPMAPADPLCLRECRRQTSACIDRANAAAHECAQPCADLVETARRVCAAAPRLEECGKARREASACLQPCREELASRTRECIANGQRCAASCPPAISDSGARAH